MQRKEIALVQGLFPSVSLQTWRLPAIKLLYTQVVHKAMSRIGLQGTERENPDSKEDCTGLQRQRQNHRALNERKKTLF